MTTAEEHDPLTAERPYEFHICFQELEHMDVFLHGSGSKGERAEIDIATANTYLGNPISLREYTVNWGSQAASEEARSFRAL